jgi:hypothetical protein
MMQKIILVLGATGTLGKPVSSAFKSSRVSGEDHDAGSSKGAYDV